MNLTDAYIRCRNEMFEDKPFKSPRDDRFLRSIAGSKKWIILCNSYKKTISQKVQQCVWSDF